MIRAVIVDDEKKAVTALEKMLFRYCPNVTVVAGVHRAQDAMAAIREHAPDVVFLDIEMPSMNGFGLLDAIGERNFHVIFTTAYDHYALKAFRYAALDYLLKPIAEQDLVSAVSRIRTEEGKQDSEQFRLLLDNLRQINNAYSRITIATAEGLLFVNVTDILFCQAESSYTLIFLKNKDKIVSSKTLGDYEELLIPHSFFRVHHSFLINMHEVKRYIKGDGGTVVMNNGSELPVSKRKKEDFLKCLRR